MLPDYLDYQADLNALATVTAFDETSLWSMAFGRLLLRELDLLPNITALDLGCGTGFPLFELAQMHGPSSRFIGVDLWQGALARAREKQAVYGLPQVELIALMGDQLPLPDAHVDLITANLVLNNLENPAVTLSECARVLKPGGRFAATANLTGHMREFYAVFRSVLEELHLEDALANLAEHEAHRGTLDSHRQLLESHGFQITKVVEDTLTLRYLDGSALLRHWFIRVGFLPAWKAVVAPDQLQTVFQMLETRLNTVSQSSGGLRLTVPMLYLEGRTS
ncbi:MAG: class I SAM-dependent methyltransferase [Anaerolineae bacterium]|nr:class I SAM-dependent methyltransferase [Anaerolineae bacterium]